MSDLSRCGIKEPQRSVAGDRIDEFTSRAEIRVGERSRGNFKSISFRPRGSLPYVRCPLRTPFGIAQTVWYCVLHPVHCRNVNLLGFAGKPVCLSCLRTRSAG